MESDGRLLLAAMQSLAQQHTNFYSNWARLELKHMFPVYEVAIVGKDALKLKTELLKNSVDIRDKQ